MPFIGGLLQCIVCTGAWVGLGLMTVLPTTSLFSPGFRVAGVADGAVLLGWTLAATWAIGRGLGDAD